MILNYLEDGWLMITQRAHGLLAAQICAQWQKENQPSRWVETLIATAEHDDVYNELENEHLLNDTGGPVDFKQTSFDEKKSRLLIDMAETKSAFIALLISSHISFVHGKEPAAKSFLAGLKRKEKIWLRAADTSATEVSGAYELLEFCDAFSLLICQQLIQPEHRKIEISNGPDGKPYVMYAKDNRLIVEPWPFELQEFQVSYETRSISELTFKNSAAFKKAFEKAIATTQYLTIAKS